jgi:two-component system response regulator (stage 0 sporulation protein A)
MQKKKIKLLLVDDNADYLMQISNCINFEKDMEIVGKVGNGRQALEFLSENIVDVVVLDAIMPVLDGLGFLTAMQTMKFAHRPKIIVLSVMHHSYMAQQFEDLGADCSVNKTLPFHVFVRKIRTIARSITFPAASKIEKNLAETLSEIIRGIGIADTVDGHKYLHTAILRVMADKSLIEGMMLKLYPLIARECDATPERVERSMRHAIKAAWEKDGGKMMSSFLGNLDVDEIPRPTNSKFITLIADRLNFLIKEQKEKTDKIPVH